MVDKPRNISHILTSEDFRRIVCQRCNKFLAEAKKGSELRIRCRRCNKENHITV